MKTARTPRPSWAQTFGLLASQSTAPTMGHTMAKLLRAQALQQKAREKERRERE